MKYGLNSPHMVEKAEQLFLSYFSSALKDKQPGMSLALMSDAGVKIYRRVFEVDENGVPTRFEVIRENTFHKSGLAADIDISTDNFTDLQNALLENNKDEFITKVNKLVNKKASKTVKLDITKEMGCRSPNNSIQEAKIEDGGEGAIVIKLRNL